MAIRIQVYLVFLYYKKAHETIYTEENLVTHLNEQGIKIDEDFELKHISEKFDQENDMEISQSDKQNSIGKVCKESNDLKSGDTQKSKQTTQQKSQSSVGRMMGPKLSQKQQKRMIDNMKPKSSTSENYSDSRQIEIEIGIKNENFTINQLAECGDDELLSNIAPSRFMSSIIGGSKLLNFGNKKKNNKGDIDLKQEQDTVEPYQQEINIDDSEKIRTPPNGVIIVKDGDQESPSSNTEKNNTESLDNNSKLQIDQNSTPSKGEHNE